MILRANTISISFTWHRQQNHASTAYRIFLNWKLGN